jgi:sugar phosphate isomerase/epimerase
MDLSINLLGFYGAGPGKPPVSVADAVRMAAEDGFLVYDFPLSDMAFYEGDWRGEIDHAVASAAACGGVFRYAHVPFRFPWSDPSAENWAAFERVMSLAIEAASILGVSWVALHPYTTNDPVESYRVAPCRAAALEHFQPWLEQADRLGVHFAVENMQGDANCKPCRRYCARVEEVVELVDTINAEWDGAHGACWDTGHGHIAGHTQSEALKALGDRLKMIHLHDNYAGGDLHLPPYTGSIDWDDVISGLRAIGFHGDVNYEQDLRKIPSFLRPAIIRYLRDVGNSFLDALSDRG